MVVVVINALVRTGFSCWSSSAGRGTIPGYIARDWDGMESLQRQSRQHWRLRECWHDFRTMRLSRILASLALLLRTSARISNIDGGSLLPQSKPVLIRVAISQV